jgi:hypothetical protein
MAPVVGAACVVRLRAQGGKQGTKRGLKDRLMSVAKKENRVEKVSSERNTRDHLRVSIGSALGSFSRAFLFSRIISPRSPQRKRRGKLIRQAHRSD